MPNFATEAVDKINHAAVDAYDYGRDVATETYLRFERCFDRIWDRLLTLNNDNDQERQQHDE